MRRGRNAICALAAAAVLLWARSAVADAGETAFLETYRCPLVKILAIIHGVKMESSEDQDRFVILDRKDKGIGYVQCVLIDYDATAFCEAASGFFDHAEGEPRSHFVTGERLQALARLGYSLDDSKGNYVRKFPIDAENFAALADFMLTSEYEAFRGYPGLRIGFVAPMVKRLQSKDCMPLS